MRTTSIQLFGSDTMNAPWGLATRLKTAEIATQFFAIGSADEIRQVLGYQPDRGGLFSVQDFIRYLEKRDVYKGRRPNAFRVIEVLRAMTQAGVLLNLGPRHGKIPGLDDCFLHLHTGSKRNQCDPRFALIQALGPELLYALVGRGVVQIAGRDKTKGDETAGTGVIIAANLILTARHVIEDMIPHDEQLFQGARRTLDRDRIRLHSTEDVAFIEVDWWPEITPGLFLHPPHVGQRVFILGYPQVPYTRDSSLVMHSGEVTAERVRMINQEYGETAFLYSATTRPGNSGGPILSADGYLVGLASKDLRVETGKDWFAPHYAGVDARTAVRAASELGLDVTLPFEGLD